MRDDYAGTASVRLDLDYDHDQLRRVRERAAELDAGNLGIECKPDDYTAAEAFARVLASDDDVIAALLPQFTNGYAAEALTNEEAR